MYELHESRTNVVVNVPESWSVPHTPGVAKSLAVLSEQILIVKRGVEKHGYGQKETHG